MWVMKPSKPQKLIIIITTIVQCILLLHPNLQIPSTIHKTNLRFSKHVFPPPHASIPSNPPTDRQQTQSRYNHPNPIHNISIPESHPPICTTGTPPEDLSKIFQSLTTTYLSPWLPSHLSSTPTVFTRPITNPLLNSMELLLRGGAFRVRLPGDGTIRYRVFEHWTQTYRVSRMTWTLTLLKDLMKKYPEFRTLRAEFFVNVADSPRSTLDTISRDMGAIPVFSFRSSPSYVDIPVPDPVEFGSNGNYVWTPDNKTSFLDREPLLVFRGSASSLGSYHHDNWLIVPRVRLGELSKLYPNLIDAGVTSWMKLGDNLTISDIQRSIGTGNSDMLSYDAQSRYRFVADIDGGLGSSRKRGILASGSVPFFQNSVWHMWYEPLLTRFVHYIPLHTYLHDVVEKVLYARERTEECVQIVKRAQCFAKHVVSYDAALLYWKTLLEGYSQLQNEPRGDDQHVEQNLCDIRPAAAESPMGCTTGWYLFNGTVPFGCRYIGADHVPFRFECWRDIGYGSEFKFTNDPVHSVYTVDYSE